MYDPGTGVVTSAAVCRILTGWIFVVGGAPSSDGENGRIPRPLVVVHSGKMTMILSGWSFNTVSRLSKRVLSDGAIDGIEKACRMAPNRDTRCSSLVLG